jgi:hypothetical protein
MPVTTQDEHERDRQERHYHAAMARLTEARGHLNLAQAHALAAKDCPKGCGCSGCVSTRAEVEHQRMIKAIRAKAAPRANGRAA